MLKYGLSTFHTTNKPEVEHIYTPKICCNCLLTAASIVFVHGLRGHREKTWMKDGSLRPKNFLATDLSESRIMSFGYDSNIVHSDTAEITQGSLESDARSLCALLNAERGAPDGVSPRVLV